jgi:hypothetical protein
MRIARGDGQSEHGVLTGRRGVMHSFLRALSCEQPPDERCTAQQDEWLAPIAVAHEIRRPLDRLIGSSPRRDPQFPNQIIERRRSECRISDVLFQ